MGVPKLAREEDVLARHSAVLDSETNFVLVSVDPTSTSEKNAPCARVCMCSQCRVDMAISILESECHGISNLAGLGLPGSFISIVVNTRSLDFSVNETELAEADSGNFGSRVEEEVCLRSHDCW